MTIEEIDIYRTAKVLINSHGDEALFKAMWRVERYRSIRNQGGMFIWNRIANAITELQLPADLKGESIN